MKKLILSFAVLAAMAAATSCASSENNAEDVGAAIKAKIENCSDPDSLRIYVKQAQDYADKLVKSGDEKAAEAYLSEVAPVVQAKYSSAAGLFDRLKAEADSTLDTAVDATKTAADSVASKASNLKDKTVDVAKDVKDKTVDVAKDVKDKTVDVAKDVKDKTVDVAKDVKDKTVDVANDAKDKVKGALGK